MGTTCNNNTHAIVANKKLRNSLSCYVSSNFSIDSSDFTGVPSTLLSMISNVAIVYLQCRLLTKQGDRQGGACMGVHLRSKPSGLCLHVTSCHIEHRDILIRYSVIRHWTNARVQCL